MEIKVEKWKIINMPSVRIEPRHVWFQVHSAIKNQMKFHKTHAEDRTEVTVVQARFRLKRCVWHGEIKSEKLKEAWHGFEQRTHWLQAFKQ